jgi:hypothetical protein
MSGDAALLTALAALIASCLRPPDLELVVKEGA